jgi:hypothetical protein
LAWSIIRREHRLPARTGLVRRESPAVIGVGILGRRHPPGIRIAGIVLGTGISWRRSSSLRVGLGRGGLIRRRHSSSLRGRGFRVGWSRRVLRGAVLLRRGIARPRNLLLVRQNERGRFGRRLRDYRPWRIQHNVHRAAENGGNGRKRNEKLLNCSSPRQSRPSFCKGKGGNSVSYAEFYGTVNLKLLTLRKNG